MEWTGWKERPGGTARARAGGRNAGKLRPGHMLHAEAGPELEPLRRGPLFVHVRGPHSGRVTGGEHCGVERRAGDAVAHGVVLDPDAEPRRVPVAKGRLQG